MSLGTNLSRLRTQQGMSQDTLAERMDVSRQSVSKWENDSSTPELDKLVRLAEVFGVTLDELVRDAPGSPQAAPPAQVPAAPEQAAAQTVTLQKVAGIVLLCTGLLLFLLLTLLGGLLPGLLFAAPFWACGGICLASRRRVGLWCGWAVYLWADFYLVFATGARWTLLLSALFHHSSYFQEMPGQMLLAWVQLGWLVLMLALTLHAFRHARLPRDRRTALLLAIGWAALLAVFHLAYPAAMRAFVGVAQNAYRPWGWALRTLNTFAGTLEVPVFTVLLVSTAAVIRKRQSD